MKNIHDNQTIDAFKQKPMTSAERQKRYREQKRMQRHEHSGAVRMDMFISSEADVKLASLLKYFKTLHGNTSKKELIEHLIHEEYQRHVNDFPSNFFDHS